MSIEKLLKLTNKDLRSFPLVARTETQHQNLHVYLEPMFLERSHLYNERPPNEINAINESRLDPDNLYRYSPRDPEVNTGKKFSRGFNVT